jgi:hypothetical protein
MTQDGTGGGRMVRYAGGLAAVACLDRIHSALCAFLGVFNLTRTIFAAIPLGATEG